MKYLIILAFLMGGLLNYVDAQESLPEVEWSTIKPKKPKYNSRSNERLAGEIGSEVFTYNYKGHPSTSTIPPIKVFLTKYNSELSWQKVVPLNLTIDRLLLNDPIVKAIGDKLYLFGLIWDKEIMEHVYVSQMIDPQEMVYSGPLKRIMGIPGPSISFRKGEFEVVYAPNRKRILFYGRTKLKKSPNQHLFKVYDENMTLLWELDKTFGKTYEDLKLHKPNLKVSSNGDVAMISHFTAEEEKVYCLQIKEDGNEVREHLIEGTWDRCIQVQVAQNPAGTLYVAGFFERPKLENSGIFVQEIGASGTKEDLRYYYFSDPAFKYSKDAPSAAYPNRPLTNELMLQQDGNILLITLLAIPYTHAVKPSVGLYRSHIMITSLSPDEEVNWSTLVPRCSPLLGLAPDEFYYPLVLPDRICFITDQLAPESKGGKKSKNKYRSINLSSLDKEGNIENQTLFEFPEEGVYIQPFIGFEQTRRQLLIRVVKGDNGHWVRLKF
ncbi:MAG: hypothetical protein AB8H47_13430 [Bacteroidia bacterium]